VNNRLLELLLHEAIKPRQVLLRLYQFGDLLLLDLDLLLVPLLLFGFNKLLDSVSALSLLAILLFQSGLGGARDHVIYAAGQNLLLLLQLLPLQLFARFLVNTSLCLWTLALASQILFYSAVESV